MKSRYSSRLPIQQTVEVFKQEKLLGRYTTRNMDVKGIFIEMPVTDLELNDMVKLVFALPDYENCDHTLMAGVVRLDSDGAGMILFDHEHKALDILRAADRSDSVPDYRMQGRPGSAGTDDRGYA
jgi:hypothetical protein